MPEILVGDNDIFDYVWVEMTSAAILLTLVAWMCCQRAAPREVAAIAE